MPEVLRKYIPGAPDFIGYTKDLPKDSTSQKAKDNAAGPKPKLPSTDQTADEIGKMEV